MEKEQDIITEYAKCDLSQLENAKADISRHLQVIEGLIALRKAMGEKTEKQRQAAERKAKSRNSKREQNVAANVTGTSQAATQQGEAPRAGEQSPMTSSQSGKTAVEFLDF